MTGCLTPPSPRTAGRKTVHPGPAASAGPTANGPGCPKSLTAGKCPTGQAGGGDPPSIPPEPAVPLLPPLPVPPAPPVAGLLSSLSDPPQETTHSESPSIESHFILHSRCPAPRKMGGSMSAKKEHVSLFDRGAKRAPPRRCRRSNRQGRETSALVASARLVLSCRH